MKKIGALHATALWLAVFIIIAAPGKDAAADTDELENFIRARIDIGETMTKFMREQSGMDRSTENMKKMETEINSKVAEILKKYGMTIEEYREQSPVVFADEAKVTAFLEANPDLKKRYEVLPLHRAPERRGRHAE
jgi:phage host-nuclease inhibitor protein Gam